MPKISKFAVLVALASAVLMGCNNSHTAYALTEDGQVVAFNTSSPGTISGAVTISGLNSGQGVAQMALDPLNSTVYCITGDGYLCTLDPSSGVASLISTSPFTLSDGTQVTLSHPVLGFDPTVQVLRVIDPTYNLLIDPTTGNLIQGETKLGYDSDDTHEGTVPSLTAMAYVPTSNSTTLYALDSATASLVHIGDENVSSADSANSGDVHTIGATGVTFTTDGGFTIDSSGNAYAILQATGTSAVLYTVDLDTGLLTNEGTLGTINGDSSTLTIESLLITD